MTYRAAYRRHTAWALLLSATLAGCDNSPYRLVPVSGTVRLDGFPLPNARIGFEPIGTDRALGSCPGSYGTTDEGGAFRLSTRKGKLGAVTGAHQVWIRTFRGHELPGGGSEVTFQEILPTCHHDATELRFDVPADGTNEADFNLQSDKT